jgi:hypothetical protein
MARSKRKSPGRAFKHGGYSLMVRSGELPYPKRQAMTRVRQYLGSVRVGLIRDIAGTEANLSTSQRILIDRAVSILSVIRTIEVSLSESGIIEGQGKDVQLQSILRDNYLAYSNSLRLILRELGIEKKAVDDVLDLTSYVKEFEKQKAAEAQAEKPVKAKGKGKGRVKIVDPESTSSDVSEPESAGDSEKAEEGGDRDSGSEGTGSPESMSEEISEGDHHGEGDSEF